VVFLWLVLAIIVVGIIIYFSVKKSKVRQEEHENNEIVEGLPKFKFDD
jgi:hypothetical protein